MPTINGTIGGPGEPIIAGDNLTVDRTVSNVPAGQTIVKAWLTVKAKAADLDAAAIFPSKVITGVATSAGQILDAGAGGTASLRFKLLTGDTILCKPRQRYAYDVQLQTSTGEIYTPEVGTIRFEQGVTDANA